MAKTNRFVYVAAAFVAINGALFGYDTGIISGPLYISETAPPEIRGSVVSFNQLAITSVILIAYLVGFALSFSGGWRLMLGLGAVPALILGLGVLFMSESPAGH